MSDAVANGLPFDAARYSPQASLAPGTIWQTREGRLGYFAGLNGVTPPAQALILASGQIVLPKAAVAILDGGEVWWDRSNGVATYQRLPANRGFFAGSAVGDALAGDGTLTINPNVATVWELELARQPFTTAIIKTAGAPSLNYRGGLDLLLDNTNEAQKVDALSNDYVLQTGKPIVRARLNVINGGAASNGKFFFGLASGTHATDPTAVTEYLYCEIDGNSTKIQFLSSDGTHTVAETDSLQTYTAGTPFEIWFDLRDPTNVKIYVNGLQVLANTTFNLSSGSSNLKLLAWLGKTASTVVMEVSVDAAKVRTAEQSVNGI